LAGFLHGRLATAGLVAAAFSATACHRPAEWPTLDTALDARTPSPALRRASRAQGRALLRAGRAMWPSPTPPANPVAAPPLPPASPLRPAPPLPLDLPLRPAPPLPPAGAAPHQPIALGLVAAAAGLGPGEAAVAAAHGAVTGPAGAAVRLLGLDPYAVHALLARLAQDCDRIAADAVTRCGDPVDDLPAAGSPLLDIGAEEHATWEVRLFAS
jgi:urease accessory protein